MSFNMTKTVEFDAGHRVPDHKSKCKNPHGHRYSVTVQVATSALVESGSSSGMVLDFGDVKTLLMEKVHDVLDHGFIVYEADTVMLEALLEPVNSDPRDGWKVVIFPYIPTAENIARWCYEQLQTDINGSYNQYAWLDSVTVFETPTSSATYDGVYSFVGVEEGSRQIIDEFERTKRVHD